MPYDAKIIEVIIASPGDVADERQIVREVIAEWNAINARERKVALMPIGWETHTSPELAGRPQQIINDRLLVHADILVGIFWTRVGSPTGKAISGSVEEIEEHLKRGKPVMLYFSNVPVARDSVDQSQYQQLTDFKAWAKERGLVEFFESREDFRQKFQRQLPITLRDNRYLQGVLPESKGGPINSSRLVGTIDGGTFGKTTIGEDAREILSAAVADPQGMIMIFHVMAGTIIQVNNRTFGEADNRRSIARWEAAIEQLKKYGLIQDTNGQGKFFKVTNAGYSFIETGT